jgi:hypothetical protein
MYVVTRIFFASGALCVLSRGLPPLACATAVALLLAYDIWQNASNMRLDTISEGTISSGLRGLR